MHLELPRWGRSNSNGHRKPEKFTGRVTITHDVSATTNFIVYDDNSRPFMLTEIRLDMFSFPIGEPEVDIELHGVRVTKSLEADLRSTSRQIGNTNDKVLAEVCEAFNISTKPDDLIAQAFRKH